MKRHAFSLVELSIVLVILGLLVGGVLSGQSLIHAAQLRSVTEDRDKYSTAFNTFKDKYFAKPGDMPNATAFWGAADSDPTTCLTTAVIGTLTCNGNGNGTIDAGFGNTNESPRVWQHLANAGMIEGTYHADGTHQSFPSSKLDGDLTWEFYYLPYTAPNTNINRFGGDYSNSLSLMGWNYPADIIPEDAWNIDTKADDGQPGTGKILTIKTCTTASTPADTPAAYQLSSSNKLCLLYFMNAI